GNDDRNGVPAIGRAYCPPRVRIADLGGDLAITACGTIRNGAQRTPYALLEGGAAGCQGQIKLLKLAAEIGLQLTPDLDEGSIQPLPGVLVTLGHFPFWKADQLQGVAIAGQQQVTDGRVHISIKNRHSRSLDAMNVLSGMPPQQHDAVSPPGTPGVGSFQQLRGSEYLPF